MSAPIQGNKMFEIDARGATQVETAGFSSKMVGFLSLEVCVTALAAGLYRHSLATGLVVFVGFYLMFSLETLKYGLAFFLSLFWGALAVGLVRAIDPNESAAWIIAGAVAAGAILGAHLCLFQWQKGFRE
jgi:hypothetical protein